MKYRSAAQDALLLHWLFQIGVATDTLRAVHEQVARDLRHAELAAEVHRAAGSQDAVSFDEPQLLSLPQAKGRPILERATVVVGDLMCCAGTVHRALMAECCRLATEPVARRALEEISSDGSASEDLAWSLLEELVGMGGPRGRSLVAGEHVQWIERMSDKYDFEDLGERHEHEWGILSPGLYPPIVAHALDELVRPRFLGLLG